jgi:hypothetical protein
VGRTLVANRLLAGSACGKRQRVRPLNSVVRRHLIMASATRMNGINAILGRSPVALTVSVVGALASGLTTSAHGVAVYALAVVLAVFSAGAILASVRFYHPWLSLVAWGAPALPFVVFSESVRTGAVSVGTAAYVYAVAAGLMFGFFIVASARIRRWVETGAF